MGGCIIEFAAPPILNLSIPVIKFHITLNGSNFAAGVLQGLIIGPNVSSVQVSINLKSIVLTKNPVKGIASTAKGFIKGAMAGTLNGLLFGNWGHGVSVVGVHNFELYTSSGSRVKWLEEVLDTLDIEKDLEAVKRLRSKAGKVAKNVKDGFVNVSGSFVDAAVKSGSKCVIM